MGSVDSSEVHEMSEGQETVDLLDVFRTEDDDSTSRFRRSGLERRAEMDAADDWPAVDPELDEYDPRKTEYIRPATAEEVEEANRTLFQLQAAQLERAIDARMKVVQHEKAQVAPGAEHGADKVLAHYRTVLSDLRGRCPSPTEAPVRIESVAEACNLGENGLEAQGIFNLSSCRGQRARRSSREMSCDARRRMSIRRAPPTLLDIESTSSSPIMTPKRSLDSTEDCYDALPDRPRKRISIPNLLQASSAEVIEPRSAVVPSFTSDFARTACIQSDLGLMAMDLEQHLIAVAA